MVTYEVYPRRDYRSLKTETTVNQKAVCVRHHRATVRKLDEVYSCSQ